MTHAITDEDARYAHDLVATICARVGPGLPGSAQERQRAAILQQELERHLGRDHAISEEFVVAPRAFLASLPIGASLTLAAAILYVFTDMTWAAMGCSTVAVLLVTLEFLLGFEVIDRFFAKQRSQNVIGTLRAPGTQEVTRLLMLSGHHDSAPENTWLRFLGYGGLVASATMLLGFVAMFALCILRLAGVDLGGAALVVLAYPILPSVVVGMFFTRGHHGGGNVPGAVDNLAASAVTVSLCRFLVTHPDCIPPGTEIRFISFGSEEAGMRGSRRYVERHRDELARLDARLLNMEMIAHPTITILTSDMNGSVRSSAEMVSSVIAAAESAGVPYQVKSAGAGVGTDAGPFSRAGLKATTLLPFKVPQQLVAFYHQDKDRPDVLTLPPLLNVLKLALAWIRQCPPPDEPSRSRSPRPGSPRRRACRRIRRSSARRRPRRCSSNCARSAWRYPTRPR